MYGVLLPFLLLILGAQADFWDDTLPLWDTILKNNVRNTTTTNGTTPTKKDGIEVNVVDYQSISEDPTFSQFIQALETIPPANVTTWESNHWTFNAFWINVYNALAVNTIINNPCKSDIFGNCGPADSIRDGGSLFSQIWVKRAGIVGGKVYSLNDVEDRLRSPPSPLTEDSRLHAAIVCASVSCPNLRPEAYRPEPEILDYQLSDNTQNFLNNVKKGLSFDSSSKELTLSSIFTWFAGDFNDSKVVDWLTTDGPNVPPKIKDPVTRAAIKDPSVSLTYFTYNWNTNGVPPKSEECSGSRPCLPIWGFLIVIGALFLLIIDAIILFWRFRKEKSEITAVVDEETDPLIKTSDRPSPLRRSLGFILKLDLFIILLVVIIVAIIFHTQTLDLLQRLFNWVDDHKVVGAVVYVFLYIIFTIVPAPGLILTLGAGALFGVPLGVLIVFIGAGIGMIITFLLGRYLFRDWVASRVAKYEKFRAIDGAIGDEGWKIVLLLRLAPVVPYNLLNYGLALTDIKFAHYALASCFGILPGTTMYAFFGSTAKHLSEVFDGSANKSYSKIIVFSVSSVCIVVLVVFITIIGRRALKKALDKQSTAGSVQEAGL